MESINQLVQSPIFAKTAPLLAVLLMVAFFWWRAGSIHSVLDRFWLLIVGRTEIKDPTLQSFFQKSIELEKFRFVYKLNVKSAEDVKKLDYWMEQHNVGLSQVQEIRKWIRIDQADVIMAPPRIEIVWRGITIFLCMIFFYSISSLNLGQYAYLQMRESGVWFKTDLVSISAPFGGWKFSLSTCRSSRDEIMKRAGLLREETKSVCDGIEDGSLKRIATESLETQKWIASIFSALLLVGMIFNLSSLKSAAAARELMCQIKGNKESDDSVAQAESCGTDTLKE